MLVEHCVNKLIASRLQLRHEEGVVEPAVKGGRVCAELSGDFSDRHARSQQLDGHGLLIFAALATAFGLHGPLTLGQAKPSAVSADGICARGRVSARGLCPFRLSPPRWSFDVAISVSLPPIYDGCPRALG